MEQLYHAVMFNKVFIITLSPWTHWMNRKFGGIFWRWCWCRWLLGRAGWWIRPHWARVPTPASCPTRKCGRGSAELSPLRIYVIRIYVITYTKVCNIFCCFKNKNIYKSAWNFVISLLEQKSFYLQIFFYKLQNVLIIRHLGLPDTVFPRKKLH